MYLKGTLSMFNQLVNFHSYYNPFRLQLSTSQHRVPCNCCLYIPAGITQARFLSALLLLLTPRSATRDH